MTISKKLTFIHDPGHGWLRVPIKDIAALGIENDISLYSYADGRRYAFLEEDCDYAVFIEACQKQGIKPPEITQKYVNRFNRDGLYSFSQIPAEFWDSVREANHA